MRRLVVVLLPILGVVLWVATTPLAATASTTTTYHGTFTDAVTYTGCTGDIPSPAIASGTWNVAVHGTGGATVSFDIFVDGAHHVSFGGTYPQGTRTNDQRFVVVIPTLAGTLTVSLTGGDFTYQIAAYDLYGVTCPAPGGVTYHGVLDRGH